MTFTLPPTKEDSMEPSTQALATLRPPTPETPQGRRSGRIALKHLRKEIPSTILAVMLFFLVILPIIFIVIAALSTTVPRPGNPEIGGFTSPNNGVDASNYPDDTSRQIADALVNAKNFRFDMSDQAPSAFGGTSGSGEWKILLDFYQNPTDIQGIATALEAAATADYGK